MMISKQTFLIILGTVIVYAITKTQLLLPYSFPAVIFLFLGLILTTLYLRSKKTLLKNKLLITYFLFITILLLIGSTGWFFSPFFFLLYPLTILTSFLFSTKDSYVLAATIAGLFIVNIGEVDLVYDILVILSYLTVIPLIHFLRKSSTIYK